MSERQKYGLVDREGLERFVKKVEELASEAQPVDRAEFERLENRLIEAEGHISQLLDNVQAMNSELLDLMERNQEPQPDSDGWIPWHGGECPFKHPTKIDVLLRNGVFIGGGNPHEATWKQNGGDGDIIAYRPAKQEAEWPQVGDEYWYINNAGRPFREIWEGMPSDAWKRDFLGIYPTREQAEEAAAKIKRVMEHWRKGEAVYLINGDAGERIEL